MEYDSVHVKGTTLTIKGITAVGEVTSSSGTVSDNIWQLHWNDFRLACAFSLRTL